MTRKLGELAEKDAEKYLLSTGNWEKCKGFAINTKAMNLEAFDEVFFTGTTLGTAIGEFARQTTWWSYKPSDEEQIFEDIFEAVDFEKEQKQRDRRRVRNEVLGEV